jgi:hypothetical protein
MIARAEVQGRFSGLFRTMSVWHALAGEQQEAALAAGVALATERESRRSPSCNASSCERSTAAVSPSAPLRPGDFVEDTATCRGLRDRFFADLREPRMRDVARLDLAEVAYWALKAPLLRKESAEVPLLAEAQRVAHLDRDDPGARALRLRAQQRLAALARLDGGAPDALADMIRNAPRDREVLSLVAGSLSAAGAPAATDVLASLLESEAKAQFAE